MVIKMLLLLDSFVHITILSILGMLIKFLGMLIEIIEKWNSADVCFKLGAWNRGVCQALFVLGISNKAQTGMVDWQRYKPRK